MCHPAAAWCQRLLLVRKPHNGIIGFEEIMGSLTITIPQKMGRSFRVKDEKFAERLVAELESFGEQTSAFDDVVGIWKGRKEKEKELTASLRSRNNIRHVCLFF